LASMVTILLFHDAYAPGQKLVGVIPHLQPKPGLKLRMLGGALLYDRTRANPRNFNATHWIGHASAMQHGTIFFDLKITLDSPDDKGCATFSEQLPDSMLPSFSSAYNTAFVTVSYGLCLHSESGEVLSVEPVTITQNAPEESGRMNKKTRLATFVTRNLNWYYHSNSSYLAATVDMDEVDNLTSGSTLSLRLHARSVQVKSLRFTVEQRLELALPYDGQTRRVKQKAVIASSIRELSSSSPSEFKKRYFITMPTLCTTITSALISTKYTVRIQMTSARTAMLTLEVPVTMYSKGSFINGLPSPMSNPGLTPEWASIVLDSHQKIFANECAICFSDISHEFGTTNLDVKADEFDDVASAGTMESDDYAPCRPATFIAHTCDTPPNAALKGELSEELPQDALQGPGAAEDMVRVGPMSSGAASPTCSSPANVAGALDKCVTPSQECFGATVANELKAEMVADDRDVMPDIETPIRLDRNRQPDAIAEDILNQHSHLCTREQLDFLYKTCRYREEAMRKGVAYASCGHAFHPICLLEYEKHAGQRSGNEGAIKCPLCRQPYTVKHFIPDENLRSLCLEHTLNEAIVLAEAAAKEAEEKAKEAAHCRSLAAHAAQHAVRLRQQAGLAFCSSSMATRLATLAPSARLPDPARPAAAGMSGRAGAIPPVRPAGNLLTTPVAARGDTRIRPSDFVTASTTAGVHVQPALAVDQRHRSPAVAAAVAVAPVPPPGPDFDLGVHVRVHEQIATMRISTDTESLQSALQSALQHPDVVLGMDEPE
jgi:hypothetical protein